MNCLFYVLYGAPGGIRTPDQVVRSHLLYPAELRMQIDDWESSGAAHDTDLPFMSRVDIKINHILKNVSR